MNIPAVDTPAKHIPQSKVANKESKPLVSSSTSPSQPIVPAAASSSPQSTGKQGVSQKVLYHAISLVRRRDLHYIGRQKAMTTRPRNRQRERANLDGGENMGLRL